MWEEIPQVNLASLASAETHPVALQVSHLDLKQGQVSEDLQVVFVPLQGVAVTLDGLVVLLIRALQEAIDVPALETRSYGRKNSLSRNVSTKETAVLLFQNKSCVFVMLIAPVRM